MTKNEDDVSKFIISYLLLRRWIGLLGIALPIVLVVGFAWIDTCHNSSLQGSISAYYYTKMGDYLVGTLCAVGLFLFAYRGYDRLDNIAGNIGGFCAIGVAFFPMDSGTLQLEFTSSIHNGIFAPLVGIFHYVFAGGLFLTLAFFSLYLFTKSDPKLDELKQNTPKRHRNKIYRVCGYVIVSCLVLMFINLIINLTAGNCYQDIVKRFKPLFWLESISLWAFGLSWLTKGEFLFPDKSNTSSR